MNAPLERVLLSTTPHFPRLGMYAVLSDAAHHPPVGEWLARIISSWLSGGSALPAWLGLGSTDFTALMDHYFPGVLIPQIFAQQSPPDPGRDDERQELTALLLNHATLEPLEASWLARILAEGSLGKDHLWQDLGLWSRKDLSALLDYGFSPLAKGNHRDMKWKKFFYKQLCEAAHIRLCRAPSCDACIDYEKCFGPEI
ncbi:MAG: nitrogen fixation protein NifQ [Magnetococcales bacterium]|nr:nitrogen fixation protein NifQ [Magnetococcales bacterium]NGZ25910.1 nitrogen fixation protein NifQ [Magnetococcales bacterium]